MEEKLKTRIQILDVLRGLVMLIMALDHVRDFFHHAAFTGDPLDLQTTTIPLYFTRWITHFCAPIFVFLCGTSIYLQSQRKSNNELSGFLFKRGIWLVLMELIIINFAWSFDSQYRIFVLQVIWAIGASMILMALISRMPFYWILAISIVIIAGHNSFDFIESTHQGLFWDLLRNGNFTTQSLPFDRTMFIIYPVIPWLGVMMLGFCFGKLYTSDFDQLKRHKILVQSAVTMLILFIVLRFINVYGDPKPWELQNEFSKSVLSFLNVNKYPPSLFFILITIAVALLLMHLWENARNKMTEILAMYGRVAFFYYILHFYLIHIMCMFSFLSRGHSIDEATPPVLLIPFKFLIPGQGYSLEMVYIVWIVVIIALYPACRWYDNYKRSHKHWWLSYL